MTDQPYLLSREQMPLLADVLGDGPLHTIACHVLRHGWGEAWVIGPVENFTAAVVRNREQSKEPQGFGQPEALGRILRKLPNWDCVEVTPAVAEPLAEIIAQNLGGPCQLYDDLHHVLRRPVTRFAHPCVRLLQPGDHAFVRRAMPKELNEPAARECRLDWAIWAVAIVDDVIVADACTSHWTGGWANISVDTLPAYRNRGYCTAAASLVAQAVQAKGDVPVWSAGEENVTSLRVAQKLGFEPVGKLVYVNKTRGGGINVPTPGSRAALP